jgi:hypothetical protein
MVSSPEYEAATQAEAKMECDKDFLGEITIKQIESNNIYVRYQADCSFQWADMD